MGAVIAYRGHQQLWCQQNLATIKGLACCFGGTGDGLSGLGSNAFSHLVSSSHLAFAVAETGNPPFTNLLTICLNSGSCRNSEDKVVRKTYGVSWSDNLINSEQKNNKVSFYWVAKEYFGGEGGRKHMRYTSWVPQTCLEEHEGMMLAQNRR